MEILIEHKKFRDQIAAMCNMIDLILNLVNSSGQNINKLKRKVAKLQPIQFHQVLS